MLSKIVLNDFHMALTEYNKNNPQHSQWVLRTVLINKYSIRCFTLQHLLTILDIDTLLCIIYATTTEVKVCVFCPLFRYFSITKEPPLHLFLSRFSILPYCNVFWILVLLLK